MPPRFVARQLSCPSGLFGSVMGKLMNRHNAQMNAFAVRLLDVSPSDRVLELGFGGGVNLAPLINMAGSLVGLDRSDVAVRQARTRFSDAVASGRAEFHEGTIESLPFDGQSFDKVCTVNTVYFWRSLEAGFSEVHRVLIPAGRFVVGFQPKEWMDRGGFPPDIFTSRGTDEVIAALSKAGFKEVHTERPTETTRWNVVVANR
jgi:SAM-dependent methyltransferase